MKKISEGQSRITPQALRLMELGLRLDDLIVEVHDELEAAETPDNETRRIEERMAEVAGDILNAATNTLRTCRPYTTNAKRRGRP